MPTHSVLVKRAASPGYLHLFLFLRKASFAAFSLSRFSACSISASLRSRESISIIIIELNDQLKVALDDSSSLEEEEHRLKIHLNSFKFIQIRKPFF